MGTIRVGIFHKSWWISMGLNNVDADENDDSNLRVTFIYYSFVCYLII